MMQRMCILSFSFLMVAFAAQTTTVRFTDVTESSGLQKSLVGMMGHSSAWGDFDRDSLLDLFVAGFCDRPVEEYRPAPGPAPARLFRQLPNGKFQLVEMTPNFCARSSAALFSDLNGDQYPELFVSNNARSSEAANPPQKIKSKLFANEKGKLREVLLDTEVFSARNVATFDYNGDGLLDLFLAEDPFKKGSRTPGSVLLKNLGHLKFQNANQSARIPTDVSGLGIAVADINEDGKPDFFVAFSNRFFLSQSGNTFHEIRELNQTFNWKPLDNEDWPSGVAFGDLNIDGNLDLVISNHHEPARNRVFLNRGLHNGIPSFVDITRSAGIADSVPVKCPHVEIQDFNNDGLPDIYFSAAWTGKNETMPLIYWNQGIGANSIPRFQRWKDLNGPMSYFPAGPTADFDKDGKLDIFLVSWVPSAPSHLLKNETAAGNWLEIHAPIGTKIKLFSSGRLVGNQQLFPGFGFSSGQPPILHFGLGKIQNVDLEAVFPNGKTMKKNIRVNRIFDVEN